MKYDVAFSAVVAMLCFAGYGAIEWREEIPAFRQDVDGYKVHGHDVNGGWEDGVFFVSVTNRGGFYMEYSRYPGMKPFRGARELILDAVSDVLPGAVVGLYVAEFPDGKSEPLRADLSGEMRFKADLDPSKLYQLRSISVNYPKHGGRPWKVGFRSLGGVFESSKADALRVDAETGNPLHIVREGKGERPVLVVRNASQGSITAHGTLKAKDFFGGSFDIPVDVSIEGGGRAEIQIADPKGENLKKSVWKIGGRLVADDGSEKHVDTRFAVMDLHERTPKQPRGTFRLGINWHLALFTPEDRNLTAAAMVACGAKLARANVAAGMGSILQNGPDEWDFSLTDSLMDILEINGLSLDTIIFSVPQWAAPVERRTNSNWRVWARGAPMPGLFERFCEGLAARYGTRIDYYEIGNEWDLFFKGTFDEAVAIQREAYRGVKRGCPDACVIPNGWAAGGDSPLIVRSGRPGLHEYLVRNARDSFDVHAVHIHGAFATYVKQIRESYFPLRGRAGVEDKPWYSNETADSSVRGERDVAITLWKKILWAWANGSVDYIWYNLKGTGWNPKDGEQGFGILTADFMPRDTYVAFAALATVVGGGEYRRTLLDDGTMYCYEFAKDGNVVLVAWKQYGDKVELPVATDASRAWLVDLMGNRTALAPANGKVAISFANEPCAVVLEGASFAKVDAAAFGLLAANGPGVVEIPPESPGRKPDFVLERSEQVHDFFVGAPNDVQRLWKGPKDNSAKVWLSKDARGLRIRVEAEDDVHCQPFDGVGQFKGDDVQVAVEVPGQGGNWEFGFAHRDDGSPAVCCWISPSGFDAEKAAAKVELKTGRDGSQTRYDALLPYCAETGFTEKSLGGDFRFNLMLNDNDGSGRDATIEIVPDAFHSKDIMLAPVVRFAAALGATTVVCASDMVNCFVGTGGNGHCFPAAAYPFGLVQAGPDTGWGTWDYCSGYRYEDGQITMFSQTHNPGGGCPDYADIGIMPFVGDATNVVSTFSHENETTTPGYYAVTLDRGGIRVEIAAAEHSAIYRIRPERPREMRLLVDLDYGMGNLTWAKKTVEPLDVRRSEGGEIRAHLLRNGFVKNRHIGVDIRCDPEPESIEELPMEDGVHAPKYVLSFNVSSERPLFVKCALSTTDADGAARNLDCEIPGWDFDAVRLAARSKWNKVLSRVEVDELDADANVVFATSLYHMFLVPTNIADVDGRYRGADGRIAASPLGRYYSELSLWDTFRGAHPFYTIAAPEYVPDFVNSMLAHFDAAGYLPVLPKWGQDSQCMIGTHAVSVIAEACFKGFKGVNRERAYRAVKDTLTQPHKGRIKEDWDLYDRYGYYPFDKIIGESVSRTLECSYDDWCAMKMAESIGHEDDAAFFRGRANCWTNVMDVSTGFVRGRDTLGRWRTPFDPFQLGHGADTANDFTEGNAYQYSWHVLQDPEGLVEAMGGKRRACERLDALFAASDKTVGPGLVVDVTGLIGQYAHGNEPSHHIPYLYQYAGRPDRTAERVREICRKFYKNTPDGLCGNEDHGEMSAWYVFACLGFYPVNPASGDFVIGAPQLSKVTLNVGEGRRFTVVARNLSEKNLYVKSVTLNGKPLDGFILRYCDIVAGGELVFEMSDKGIRAY